MRHRPDKKPRPPLDGETLERLALHYAGRYATTRAKLRAYLMRKLRERGWEGQEAADHAAARIVERFEDLGYVNDGAFAEARAASLGRRGYGERRVAEALNAAGIEEEDAGLARELARENAWAAALRFAKRRRVGPYATETLDRDQKQKAFAAMIRAGHPADIARRLLEIAPGGDVEALDANFA